VHLDNHRSQVSIDVLRSVEEGGVIDLDVDWATAYELVLSLSTFLCFSPQSLIELGQAWPRQVRQQLPQELLPRFSRKALGRSFKDQDTDLLFLLVQACPGNRDASTFVNWFVQLTPGTAYEAVAPRTPEHGPRLPRDFTAWRDSIGEVLDAWTCHYFRGLDPALLDGLGHAAGSLVERLPTADPLELIEEMTNGLVIEPSSTMQHVILVPQHHHRPYNHMIPIQNGVVLMYPCDVLPADPQQPPAGLVRLTHALSDESRLRILRFLAKGPCTLTEVARHAGLSQPTVHHHLTQLRAAGLVRIHFVLSNPSRYSLRPHALEQLSDQLGAYLLPDVEDDAI
jgi:DNA-binding transcriptional ArsR family regulator